MDILLDFPSLLRVCIKRNDGYETTQNQAIQLNLCAKRSKQLQHALWTLCIEHSIDLEFTHLLLHGDKPSSRCSRYEHIKIMIQQLVDQCADEQQQSFQARQWLKNYATNTKKGLADIATIIKQG